MCYIWRCDADDFDHSGPLHVYIQHITPWNRIPFIFDESGNARRIHHIRLNVRSSCPIICMDEFNNRYPVSHVLIWRLDRSEATWGVFDNRHAARASDWPLFDPLFSYELPITSAQANALAQWYDEHENRGAIARGLGFASGRGENNRTGTRLTPHTPRPLGIDERPIFERIRVCFIAQPSYIIGFWPYRRPWLYQHDQQRHIEQQRHLDQQLHPFRFRCLLIAEAREYLAESLAYSLACSVG